MKNLRGQKLNDAPLRRTGARLELARLLAGWTTGLLLAVTLIAVSPTGVAQAKVTGTCSSCHTMHYSQGGTALAWWSQSGPNEGLLATDCLGCHTGANSGGTTPFVFDSAMPDYDNTGTEPLTTTLAGGSFHWVAQAAGDATGHNVVGVVGPDATLSTPPGFSGSRAAADGSVPGGGSWPAGQQVTCAGTYGCHGTHNESSMAAAIRYGHHDGVGGAIVAPGTTPAGGYRMLVGVAGYEDPDWEYRPTATEHNQYKGVDGGLDNSTISSLCARCHDQFHDGGGSGSPWLRHPIDYDMGNTAAGSEFRDYGGAGVNAYRVDTPVASVDVSSPLATVTFGGDTIIGCLSCHRAHGSPFNKMMRWDYAGSIGTGCVNCHTSKD